VTELRIALVQLKIRDGQPRTNLERANSLIRAAAPADLIVLPELWTSGYAHGSWARTARVDTPIICAELAQLSTELGAVLAGSMVSLDEQGRLRNRLWVFSPDGGGPDGAGPVGGGPVTYDKGHLFAPLGEDRYLTAGSARVRVPLGPWTVALSICFDLRFPEMYRLDTLAGADLFLVVAAWPETRLEALRFLARARATENQAFLVLCNRIGPGEEGVNFGGGSMVVAPDGRVVADAGAEEGIARATIDQGRVAEVRTGFPVLSLRREGVDW
jgi:predicted amidohydrolase